MASRFKSSGRRLRAALVAGGLLGALVAATGGVPAQAQAAKPGVPFGGGATAAQFSAHASGSLVHAKALEAAVEGPRIVDAEVGFSNAAFNSAGVEGGIDNEMGVAVVPAGGSADAQLDSAGKESYAKGSGVEVGLAQDLPAQDTEQIELTQAAGASHPPARSDGEDPPNAASSGLVTSSLVDVPAGPLLFASAARGKAGAVWNPQTCIAGQPISFGEGSVAQVDVLDTGESSDTGLEAPVVTLESENQQQALESQSFTYLVANTGPDGKADGTFGVVSETRQILAPVTLADSAETNQGALTIDIAGTWVLKVTATGKGPATVEYGVEGLGTDVPVIRFLQDGVPIEGAELTLDMIFGDEGFTLPPELAPLLGLAIAEQPRAISPSETTVPNPPVPPITEVTHGQAAVDVIRLDLLNVGLPDSAPEVVGLRIGHMEADVKVPAGGIRCQFPVKKEIAGGVTTVQTGQEFTWTITIPSDPDALAGIACKLTNISAVDNIITQTGSPNVTITSVSNGGSINADKRGASWTGLGTYDPNDPNRQPIILTVKATASGAGTFLNTVDVTATLGECTGGGLFEGDAEALADFLGRAKLEGDNAINGGTNVLGVGQTASPLTAVLAQRTLPTTGASRGLTMLGIAAMLTAAGVYLFNRKVSSSIS